MPCKASATTFSVCLHLITACFEDFTNSLCEHKKAFEVTFFDKDCGQAHFQFFTL